MSDAQLNRAKNAERYAEDELLEADALAGDPDRRRQARDLRRQAKRRRAKARRRQGRLLCERSELDPDA